MLLLHSNKKFQPLEHPKPFKKPRPAAAILPRSKSKYPDSPTLPVLDSLEVRCEGMKLNARSPKSPFKRRQKVWRTDTHIRPILLDNFGLPRSNSFEQRNISFFPLLSQLPENPQDRRHKRSTSGIPASHLLLLQQSKYVELQERIAFYLPLNTFAGLHLYREDRPLPKSQGLLQSWGVCHLGAKQKKYHVSELYFGYSFRNLMSEFGKLEECTAKLFLRQLVSTINNLHLSGFYHNRLNLDSIFHDCQGRLLVNFFKASSQPIDETEKQAYLYYFSPQMLVSRLGHQTSKNDIWAIGCIALQFLSCRSVRTNQRHPYNEAFLYDRQGKSYLMMERLQKVLQRKPQMFERKHEEDVVSDEALDFIDRCLQLSEENRPKASELLMHPFLKE